MNPKPNPSCYVVSSPELLAEAIFALKLTRRGDQLFKGLQHVANIFEGRYIFFLMSADQYAQLVEAAKKMEILSAF